MTVSAPHFLLYAEAAQAAACSDSDAPRWRFVLRQPGGETEFEAADEEPAASSERLELLAVVRGLEALPQPSRVTLMSGSRYLRRGLDSGLAYWKEHDWQWERYGRMTPIKNADLWRRLDRLTEIHRVDCPPARLEGTDDLAALPPLRRTLGGKQIRIDPPPLKRKHEARNPKSETSTKRESENDGSSGVFGHSSLVLGKLFRASYFVLRALIARLRTFATGTSHNSLGETPRAHYRLARRHERPARRSTRPAGRRARAADDPLRRS